MMRYNRRAWVRLAWIIATTLPMLCRPQSRKPAPLGPDAVWNPSPDSWARLRQGCANPGPACLSAFMKQNGASPDALAAVQRFHGEAFLSNFRKFGRIGLATLVSPFEANGNEIPILANATPDVVNVVDEMNKLNPERNAWYASVKQAYPNAVFGASIPRFEEMRELETGGQRFIFAISVRDGCSACDEVAGGRMALDFDQFGLYLGPKLLAVTQVKGAKAQRNDGDFQPFGGLIPTIAREDDSRREFSADVLIRMGAGPAGNEGIGARVHVREGDLYLDFPDLAHHGHIPFWFLSNGVVASVKAATDENFDPGPGGPLFVGTLLRFRPVNRDHFCEEFRSYYVEALEAGARESGDEEELKVLDGLRKPENFPCEETGRELVAQRQCRVYRVGAISESWTFISFDPKLAAITQVRVNPPQGLILRLETIQEKPQSISLFTPPPDRIVLVHANARRTGRRANAWER